MNYNTLIMVGVEAFKITRFVSSLLYFNKFEINTKKAFKITRFLSSLLYFNKFEMKDKKNNA